LASSVWINATARQRYIQRGNDKAAYTADSRTAVEFYKNVQSLIEQIEQFPNAGPSIQDSPSRQMRTITSGTGNGDVLIYHYDAKNDLAILFGVYPSIPVPLP
jgi:hypothetical protein